MGLLWNFQQHISTQTKTEYQPLFHQKQNETKKKTIFYCYIWNQYEICIQMSTNKPSIGLVILEIAPWNLKKYFKSQFLLTKIVVIR